MTLKMTTAQVVETSVTVTNSSFQNYTHPDDHTTRTTDTPGFKPFTMNKNYLIFLFGFYRAEKVKNEETERSCEKLVPCFIFYSFLFIFSSLFFFFLPHFSLYQLSRINIIMLLWYTIKIVSLEKLATIFEY